jgi:mediator of RNA polymerase II transcription subunit 5
MTDVGNEAETIKPDRATAQWRVFIQNSLRIRLDQGKFLQLAQELGDRSPISGFKLASLLLGGQRASSKIVDPRIPIFIEQLLEARIINTDHVLAALFQQHPDRTDSQKDSSNHNGSELAVTVLDHLTKGFVTGKSPYTIPETRQSLVVLARWLESIVTTTSAGDALMQSLGHQTLPICDPLGLLATAMLENSRVAGVVAKVISKGMLAIL